MTVASSALKTALEAELTAKGSADQILDLDSYLSANTTIPDSCKSVYTTYSEAKKAYETAAKAISRRGGGL